MDTMTSKRIAKLDSVTNCPSCGGPRGAALGGKKNRKVPFSCGAVFFVDPGQPIGCLIPCPGPSNTAADYLDREIIEADHRALALTAAPSDRSVSSTLAAAGQNLQATMQPEAQRQPAEGTTSTSDDLRTECSPDGRQDGIERERQARVGVSLEASSSDHITTQPNADTPVFVIGWDLAAGYSPPQPIFVNGISYVPAPAAHMVGWLPIATAPLDKTRVIIAVPTKDKDDWFVGEAYFDPDNYEGGDWWWAGTGHGDCNAGPISDCNHHAPEYWQPMPGAPAQMEGGR